MTRNKTDIRCEEAQQAGLVHPSLERLCASSPALLGRVLCNLKDNPLKAVYLANRITARIPKTMPLATLYAKKIEDAATVFDSVTSSQLRECAGQLHSSISKPLTDLASLFQTHHTSKVLRFMSIDPNGTMLKGVDYEEIHGTCLVKQLTVQFEDAQPKKFFIKYDCPSDLKALEVLASCGRGPKFLTLSEPESPSQTPKYAALMAFEGPAILQHSPLSSEVGFDAGLALSQIHALGISHRDLAPWHVRVRPDGTVFFIDFSNYSSFNPSDLHATVRDTQLRNNILADIGDLVSMIEYAPNASSLDPKLACQRAYRSTDFYRRLLDALLQAHQYADADELCSILNSDEVDRNQVRLRQQLTLHTLAGSLIDITHSGSPVFLPCQGTIQLRTTATLDGLTTPITTTIVGGNHLQLHLASENPPLSLSISNPEAIAWFVRAILAKAPAHFLRRGQLDRLCCDAEARTEQLRDVAGS